MTNTLESQKIVAGTWAIDPTHSEVGFSVRHMMVSKVRGRFATFTGEIVTADDLLQSQVNATIELSSIDTGNEDRDNHLRSADFFEVEQHQQMTYRSTSIRPQGSDYVLDGELTLKGVTRSVPLQLEFIGVSPDPFGGTRIGFSASGEISRADFGIDFNMLIEAGGVVIGDTISINIEIEAVLQ